MKRLFVPLIATGLMIFGTISAKDTPKTNADHEAEMAADMRERTQDPASEDAIQMERVRRAGLPERQ